MAKIINFFEDIENKLSKDGEHYSEGNRNNYVLQFARLAKGKGINQNDCLQYILNNYPNAEERDVKAPATVKSVYNYNGLQPGQYSNGQFKPEQLNGNVYFSVFNCSVYAKSEKQKPYKNATLDGLAEIFQNEEKAKEISKLQYGSPEYKAKKEQYSHYFTPHGTFTQRNNKSLKILSKYLLFEADKHDNSNINPNKLTNSLKNDKRVALCFQSFSGFPKWLCKVPGVTPENFRNKYQEAAQKFEKKYNIKCDYNQGKVSQPCYFSFDPNIYVNKNASPLILPSDEVKEEATPDLLKNAKIDLTEEIPEPPTILFEGDQIFATKGNISTIIGKAKSKKSFLVTLKAAEYLQNNSGKLLFFDTEQSKYHVQKVGLRLQKMGNVSNLQLFALRPLNTDKRIEVIEHAIYNTKDAELVIIDGIRDLINDINDPQDATKISDLLLRWTNDTDVHIINILHQNKGDTNARGHVGTELVNKSETVASVKKDDILDPELSIVEAEYTRNPPFEKFAFYINQDGLPERGDVPEPEAKREIIHPGKFGEMKHKQVLSRVYSQNESYSFRKLCDAVQFQFNELGIEFGKSKARDFITFYEQNNYIKNESKTTKSKYKKTC
ncbi:MAG: BT4734/BF3469 family protein [Bacteroidales bacterium]